MIDLIASAVILVAAAALVWWYMRNRGEARALEDEEREAEEAAQLALAAGLAADDRPMWDPGDPDPLARKILDDGLAHNSKWVTPEFRRVWWVEIDAGRSMATAFHAAMHAERWRSGSQGQVYDRMASHPDGAPLIDEATRDRWKREAEAKFPSGYGRAS